MKPYSVEYERAQGAKITIMAINEFDALNVFDDLVDCGYTGLDSNPFGEYDYYPIKVDEVKGVDAVELLTNKVKHLQGLLDWERKTKRFTVPSSSIRGKFHEVSIYPSGSSSCTCEDHKFRGKDCKHIKDVLKMVSPEYDVPF